MTALSLLTLEGILTGDGPVVRTGGGPMSEIELRHLTPNLANLGWLKHQIMDINDELKAHGIKINYSGMCWDGDFKTIANIAHDDTCDIIVCHLPLSYPLLDDVMERFDLSIIEGQQVMFQVRRAELHRAFRELHYCSAEFYEEYDPQIPFQIKGLCID